MIVHAFGLTDPGKVRSTNEDQLLVADLARMGPPQQGHVLLVADGMGGHNAGEVASALSVEVVVDLLRHFSNLSTSDERGVLRELREAVQQADTRIIEEAREHREFKGMGTT